MTKMLQNLMKISEYLGKSGLTQGGFAALIGVKRLSVSRYVGGQRRPSPKTAKKIIKATEGQVGFEDLYGR